MTVAMNPKTAIPPTTPPAIAPAGTEESPESDEELGIDSLLPPVPLLALPELEPAPLDPVGCAVGISDAIPDVASAFKVAPKPV